MKREKSQYFFYCRIGITRLTPPSAPAGARFCCFILPPPLLFPCPTRFYSLESAITAFYELYAVKSKARLRSWHDRLSVSIPFAFNFYFRWTWRTSFCIFTLFPSSAISIPLADGLLCINIHRPFRILLKVTGNNWTKICSSKVMAYLLFMYFSFIK
jgi:hypothetical protein